MRAGVGRARERGKASCSLPARRSALFQTGVIGIEIGSPPPPAFTSPLQSMSPSINATRKRRYGAPSSRAIALTTMVRASVPQTITSPRSLRVFSCTITGSTTGLAAGSTGAAAATAADNIAIRSVLVFLITPCKAFELAIVHAVPDPCLQCHARVFSFGPLPCDMPPTLASALRCPSPGRCTSMLDCKARSATNRINRIRNRGQCRGQCSSFVGSRWPLRELARPYTDG